MVILPVLCTRTWSITGHAELGGLHEPSGDHTQGLHAQWPETFGNLSEGLPSDLGPWLFPWPTRIPRRTADQVESWGDERLRPGDSRNAQGWPEVRAPWLGPLLRGGAARIGHPAFSAQGARNPWAPRRAALCLSGFLLSKCRSVCLRVDFGYTLSTRFREKKALIDWGPALCPASRAVCCSGFVLFTQFCSCCGNCGSRFLQPSQSLGDL